MKKFLLDFTVFLPLVVVISAIYVWSFSINTLDFYYAKVASEKKHSMIIGNSKPSQGIKPSVLNDELGLEENQQFYNYAFTNLYSPHGPVYHQSIMSKIDTLPNNTMIYVIEVDPRTITSEETDPNDESLFRENKTFLANVSNTTQNPNLDYILFRQETFYKKMFSNLVRGSGRLHKDGWLEIFVNTDSSVVEKRMTRNMKLLRAAKYNLSDKRMSSLQKLIVALKRHGKVYLIRMPMNKKFFDYQEEVFPDFENMISELSSELNVPYKTYLNDNERFKYTDGVHLTRDSAEEFSLDLASWIKKN